MVRRGRRDANRKEESHERIVRAAARAIRKYGYEGLGVAQVMKDAGLTHGGFYAHFDSRAKLLSEAADRAGAESIENLSKVVREAKAGEGLTALVDSYLSDRHLAAIEQGCAIAASGCDVPRQPAEVRRAVTQRTKELIGLVERQLPGWGNAGSRDDAMAILGCLVGTLVLARSVDDAELSRALRKAARSFIRAAGS